MTLFGSVYYDSGLRENLRSSLPGRITELVFLFFPYVAIRPFFPTTRFSNAGKQTKARTERLEKFYEVGTTMIKIFYLWAKYFLGFHINFMTYLGIIKPENLMFVRGLYLLNAGNWCFPPYLAIQKDSPSRVYLFLLPLSDLCVSDYVVSASALLFSHTEESIGVRVCLTRNLLIQFISSATVRLRPCLTRSIHWRPIPNFAWFPWLGYSVT